MKYELKSLSFGKLCGNIFSLYSDNLIWIIPLSMAENAMLLLYLYLPNISPSNGVMTILVGAGLLVGVLTDFVLSTVIHGTITLIIARKYLNQPISFFSAVKTIRKIIFPLLGLRLMVGVYIVMGTLVFVVPGIYASIIYSLCVPVMVLEKRSIFLCLERSKILITRYQWQAFFILGPIFLSQLALSNMIDFNLENELVGIIFYCGMKVLFSPISLCAAISLYHKMRIDKEGYALEHLANEFSFVKISGTS